MCRHIYTLSALPVTCLHAHQSSFCNYIKEEHPNARTFLHAFGRSFYYCPVKRKRNEQTQAPNATSNGGDASRVRKILRLLHTTFCHARATRQNGYATRTSLLRGSGLAIRATEIPLPHYPHNIPHKHIYTTLLTVQTSACKRADRISLCLHFLTR